MKLVRRVVFLVAFASFLPASLLAAPDEPGVEPKKAEPKKAEPKKAEPKKAEPKEAEPTKADEKKEKKEEITNESCLECHGDKDSVKKKSLVDGKPFKKGPHTEDNGVTCVSCHVDAGKVEDITEHGKLGKATCTQCHDTAKVIATSVHAKPKHGMKAPKCVDCHGDAHKIVETKHHTSPIHRHNITKTCSNCHKGAAIDAYKKSVHGQLLKAGKKKGPTCVNCHGGHAVAIADVAHNAPYKVQMVKVCGGCHEKESKLFVPSAHGKALIEVGHYDAASCVDCHLSHDVYKVKDPNSNVYATKTVDVCADCHANKRMIRKVKLNANVVSTYKGSFHGRAGKLGERGVARCTSCHAVHAIYSKKDPRSWVHPDKLPKTCGKCHPGASKNFVKATIHHELGASDNYWAHFVRNLYIILIILVIGGMVVHNILDWIRKNINRSRDQAQGDFVIRMTALERFLHMMLASSFLLLCYTGFALMYPEQWWVAPLNWISDTEGFRSMLHRVCGILLTLVSVHHLYFISMTELGRKRFRQFLPGFADVKQVFQNVMWMFGRRKERPTFGFFSYMEKAEYWALVWGTFVMVVTGFILWFEETALMYMPLWLWEVCQVVHRFEAILAFAAIIVWHFYYVFVNPDEAPMSLTFITGRMTMHELAMAHPEEYAAEMERRRKAGQIDDDGEAEDDEKKDDEKKDDEKKDDEK